MYEIFNPTFADRLSNSLVRLLEIYWLRSPRHIIGRGIAINFLILKNIILSFYPNKITRSVFF